MTAFVIGDLAVLSTVITDELFTPSIPWKRRGGKPATVDGKKTYATVDGKAPIVDGRTCALEDVPLKQYGAEWWWVYFWDQAKGQVARAKPAEKNAFLAFFNQAFLKPDTLRSDAEGQRYVIPKGPLETVFAGDFSTLLAAMNAALTVGFESISKGPAGIQVSAEALKKYVLNVDKRVHYRMVWRGGEREWASVRKYGYAAAARYEADAIEWNMRQPWHPFSVVAARANVYYRKAFTDNCLFTAVSVTDDWKAAVCYPKIEQTTELMELTRQAKAGTSLKDLQARCPDRVAKVTYADGKVEYKLANLTRIALMILEGLVFDTKQRQKDTVGVSYPELGAESIVGSNVVAMLEYTRVFHGLEDRDGFTAFLHPSGSHLIDRSDLLVTFGDDRAASDYYPKIVTELNDAKVNRISLRWDPSGTAKPAQTVSYWKEVAFGDGRAIRR